MMKCTYKLAGEKKALSYEDLITTLASNFKKYSKYSVEDLVYSLGTTVQLINDIKSSVQPIPTTVYDPTIGEEIETYGNGVEAVSNYADKAKLNDGNPLFTPFNEDQYRGQTIKKLMRENEGLSMEAAKDQADEIIKMDRIMGKHASQLHGAMRAYFSGTNSYDAFYNTFYDLYKDEQVLKNLFAGLQKLESTLKNIHGEDCTFIPKVTVSNKIESEDVVIAGTIDLVVVDSNDQAHIYLIAGSSKDYDLQLPVRHVKKDYLLGFYRHMLASKGVPVRRMSLNLVPALISVDTDGKVTDINLDEPIDRKAVMSSGNMNPLTWGYGEYFNNINSKIDVPLPVSTVSDINKTIKEHTTLFFGDQMHIASTIYDMSIQQFIKFNVKDSDDISKGRYKIVMDKRDKSKDIYIKATENKFKDAEVYKVVEKLVEQQADKSKTFVEDFMDSFKQILNGTKTFEDITTMKDDSLRKKLAVNFAIYQSGTWKLIEDRPDLTAAGIIAFRNTVTQQVDFVALRTGELNTEVPLTLGSTILGNYQKDENIVGTENLLKFTVGNAALMQVMDLINLDHETFRDAYIGTIKVYNPLTGQATVASSSELKTSYSHLCRASGVENNLGLINVASDLNVFRQYIIGAMSKGLFDFQVKNQIFAELEKVNPDVEAEVLPVLNKIRKEMEIKYRSKLNRPIEELQADFHDPVVLIYAQLCKTILYYKGIPFTQSHKLFKYSSELFGDQMLNGTYISNPSTLPEENLKRIVNIARTGFNSMTNEIMDSWESFRNNEVEELWKAKGYSKARQFVLGDQNQMYRNMFVTTESGQIGDEFRLKDPEDMQNDLTSEERTFLRKWFKRMDKLRFKDDNEKQDAILRGTYYLVPLVEGTLGSKIQGIDDPVAYAKRECGDLMSYLRESFAREEGNFYTSAEEVAAAKARTRNLSEQYVVMNRLAASYNQDYRETILQQHDINFWEINLDRIYAHYLYGAVRKKHMDKVLPIIKAVRIVGALYGRQTDVNMKNFDEYLENYMTSHIHNQSILSEEEKNAVVTITPIKFMASTLAMAFNTSTGLRNLLESVWKVPMRIQTKFFTKEDCFTKTDWWNAMMALIEDGPDFASRVTLIEALNQRMRIQDMDANRIADKITSYKSGLTHTTDRLMFWFSVAPDYFNRMSMIIAQMMHDGCWEACSFTKEEGFKYDWKRDRRFNLYATNTNVGSDQYKRQRAMYMLLLRTYNEETGKNLKEGSDLPLPYTSTQINALKDFSDTVFGFYDHDQKAMVERGALASLFTQFKTYLTAGRTIWFLAPGAYNKGETEQMINEVTGKPMFLKVIEHEGRQMMVPTDEDTGIPWLQERKSYMEGIVYTFKHMWEDFHTLGVVETFRQSLSNNVRKRNLTMVMWQLVVGFLLAALMKSWLKSYKEGKTERDKVHSPSFWQRAADATVINGLRCLAGSFQDANIYESLTSVTIDSEPAAFSILNNLMTSTGEFFIGDLTLDQWFSRNFGAYRTVKPFFD